MLIKYDKNLELNCQNKFILIISDNFDRKVCNGLQSTKKFRQPLVWEYLHNYQYFVDQLASNASFIWVSGVKKSH